MTKQTDWVSRFDEFGKTKLPIMKQEYAINEFAWWGMIKSFISQEIEQAKKEERKLRDKALETVRKIDDLVSGDLGFEADCYIGLDKPRGRKPKYTDEWAKLILDVYDITHRALSTCHGANLLTEEEKKQQDKELINSLNERKS